MPNWQTRKPARRTTLRVGINYGAHNLDDAPELTDEFFERVDLYHGDKLIRPGKGGPNRRRAAAIKRTRGRPPSDSPKRQMPM
jgi:hypothetical protein